MILPLVAVFNMEEFAMLEMANDVVVAFVRSVSPESVVEAMIADMLALSWPPMFRTLLMVEEPVTAKDVEVAPWRDVAPFTVSEANVPRPVEERVPKVAPPTALS